MKNYRPDLDGMKLDLALLAGDDTPERRAHLRDVRDKLYYHGGAFPYATVTKEMQRFGRYEFREVLEAVRNERFPDGKFWQHFAMGWAFMFEPIKSL